MKKILFFLTAVLLLASFTDSKAQAVDDWSWSFPKPVGQTLRWCQMFNANTWYAVGYGGNFIKTTDAGTTWSQTVCSIPWRETNSTLYDAHFFNMNTGVAAGYLEIFRTTDGGTTWDTTSVGPTVQTSSHYKFSFINSSTGFVAGSYGRVYKTTDAGLTWINTGSTAGTLTKYSCYFIDANTGMVGESSADIWRTTNGGANWTELLYTGGTIYKINFIDASTGFASGSSTTLLKTTDAGATWAPFSTTGIPSSSLYDIDFGPAGAPTGMANESFTGTTFPPTGWRSVNVLGLNVWVRYTTYYHTAPASARISYQSTGGEDWLITPQIPVGGGDSLVFFARKFYSSTYDPDSLIVRVSTTDTAMSSFTNVIGSYNVNNFGTTTWTRVALPMGTYAGNAWIAFQHKDTDGNGLLLDDISVGLNSPPPSPTVYVTGNAFAIYRSPITSPSWDSLGFLSPTQPVTSIYYSTSLGGNGDSLLTVGAYGLINKRNNISNRTAYRDADVWFTSTLNAVDVVGNKVMVPTSYSTILSSSNGGTDWDTSRVNYSYSGTLYSISKVNNSTAWVGGYNGRTYYTTDAGASWTESTNNTTLTIYNVNFVDANTGWLFASGSTGGIEKTTDGGTTWVNQTATGVTSTIYGSSFIDANTGWLCGNSGKVSKTTDGGTTWTAQTSNYTSTLRAVDMVNANTGWLVGYSSTIRKTTNGGTNWDTLQVPFYPYSSYYAVDFVDQWNGMVVGSYGQTLRTRDGGTTWIIENTGGNSQYGVKMTTTDSGWAVSSNGYVFKYAELLNNGNTYTHEVPTKYTLSQNYPNPFNPTTTIQFGLPRAGRVSLKIYDVSGRLVRTLVNNEGLNEGTFNYIFNGSDVASGVYFYSLIVNDDLVGTKKMVLVK